MTAPVFTRPVDCPGGLGVRMLGTGSKVPDRVLTNDDLAKMMDTSDEWIVQRTGIRERRICDPTVEGTFTLSRDALQAALEDAKVSPKELDLIICGTCTMEMTCPSTACRISAALDAAPAAAFDVVAACSGFVYSLNVAETLVRSGRFRTVGVVGCDAMSTAVDFTERTVSILFGDAAGAAILRADPDPSKGAVYSSMGADGIGGHALYIPRREQDVPADDRDNPIRLGYLRMNGREVFKFAVTRFREVIEDAMAKAGLSADDVGQVVCHQSNLRIIEAAREKIGFRPDQIFVNIDRFGNSSAGSVGLCLDQARRAGRFPPGKPIIMVAFGGGLTWAANVWNF
jgi:3-oxoacyl-[acyl-carrier-protein] synthase-3